MVPTVVVVQWELFYLNSVLKCTASSLKSLITVCMYIPSIRSIVYSSIARGEYLHPPFAQVEACFRSNQSMYTSLYTTLGTFTRVINTVVEPSTTTTSTLSSQMSG